MITKAIQFIQEIAHGKVEEVAGRNYSTRPLSPIKDPLPTILTVWTLSALIDYIDTNRDRLDREGLTIHVVNGSTVDVFGPLDDWQSRPHYVRAEYTGQMLSLGRPYDPEEFIIAMQTMVVKTPTVEAILRLVGNLTSEASRTVVDDGFSQTVTARTGVAKVSDVQVPNPVVLAPYRTFPEIDQPASTYVLRIKDGPRVSLHAVEDQQWELEAVNRIAEWIRNELKERSREVAVLA